MSRPEFLVGEEGFVFQGDEDIADVARWVKVVMAPRAPPSSTGIGKQLAPRTQAPASLPFFFRA
ncbi:MAG: hypothetical protein IPJ73_22345 [Zoogloea sp.]|nr:hypothetical protein [Zoogloea sp.]